jgi:multicomponent Na+:H+ antiporter subunit D
MSKIWLEAFWKAAPVQRRQPRRVPAAVVLPIAFLAAVTVAIGLAPQPFVTLADQAALVLVEPARYVAAVFPDAVTPPSMLAGPPVETLPAAAAQAAGEPVIGDLVQIGAPR